MSTQFNGQPALIQNNLPTAKSITSTGSTAPTVVTTSTPHGCSTGDYVRVAGAASSGVNGDWICTVLSATTLALKTIPDGVNAGPFAAGVAAGTLQNLGFSTYAIPSDGDARSASSVNVPLTALGDRTAYLLYALRNVVAVATYTFDLGPGNFAETITSQSYVDANNIRVDLPDSKPGDVLTVDLSAAVTHVLAAGHRALCRLAVTQDLNGTPTDTVLPGTERTEVNPGPGSLSIAASFTVTTPGTTRVKMQARVPDTSGSDAFDVQGFAVLRVTRIRA